MLHNNAQERQRKAKTKMPQYGKEGEGTHKYKRNRPCANEESAKTANGMAAVRQT